jgi:hypothetical protein
MRASFLLLPFVAVPLAAQVEEIRLEPREVSWEAACREGLRPAEVLPWASGGAELSLHEAMQELVGLRFEKREGDEEEVYARSFGDLIAAAGKLRDRPRAQKLLLERLERTRPDVWAKVERWLPDLVQDRFVRSAEWDPAVERDDDGFAFGTAIEIGGPSLPKWREVEGSKVVQQAATLVFADLVALETAENDYRTYYDHVGASYETLIPVPGSYLRGECPDERPFAMLRLRFTADLPFPFSSYTCDLDILKRIGADGCLEAWSEARGTDFYWLAGAVAYLPVLDSEGEFVALLLVRQLGFDLRGVPDGDSDRRTSLRGLLGNLKRRAEALWLARDEDRDPVFRDAIPEVEVIGRP